MAEKTEFIFKSPDQSPGYLLAQVALILERKQKKVLDPLDLTHTQFILLASIAWLSNAKENITQVEIANFNNFDRMMVSKVLRALQTKNLITRQEHETDTRAKIVKLTPKGKTILQTALTKIENADIDFFSCIDKNIPNLNGYMQTLLETNKPD